MFKTDFQHFRTSPIDLVSLVDVETVIRRNVKISALGVQLYCETSLDWTTSFSPSEMDDRKIFECLPLISLRGAAHDGDCIQKDKACSRCLAEILYSDAENLYMEWQHEVDPLAVLMCNEAFFYPLQKVTKQLQIENDPQIISDLLEKETTLRFALEIDNRYQIWLTCSEEEKQELLKRANAFRKQLESILS